MGLMDWPAILIHHSDFKVSIEVEVSLLHFGTLIGTRPDNVQLDGGARVLEDVLRVRVRQLRGVQVVEAHHAVADVKYSFAGGSDRHLKSNPAINDNFIIYFGIL